MRKFLLVCLFLVNVFCLSASNLTPGNIVVVRVGDGTSTLTSSSTAVFLDEYTTSGIFVQTIAAPTIVSGSNHALTLSGVATSEGALTLSANGQYLTLAGYDTSAGYASVASGITNRTIARIGSNGTFNTSTGLISGSAYVTGNMRAAVSNDGSEFWTAGSGSTTGGVWYVPFGAFTSSGVQTSITINSIRAVKIFNGQLYCSTSSGASGIYSVGSGLPVTSGQTETILPGLPTLDTLLSPYAFLMLNENGSSSPNVLYAVDDDTTASNGGIYKYSLVGGTWVTNGRVANTKGLRGITGYATCSGARLYLTAGNGIYTFLDTAGYNQTIRGSYSQIVTAASNTVIRGIAFAPGTVTPTSPTVSIASKTNVTCNGFNNGIINITVTGGLSSFAYHWSDANSGQNRTNLSPASYSVTVTDQNACTTTVSTSISQPNAIVITDSVTNVACFGGSTGAVKITVTGGTGSYHYQWSDSAHTQNISSLTLGTYRIKVTDSLGCSNVDSGTVAQPSSGLSILDTVTAVTCYGSSTGSIKLGASGGTPVYTYSWTGGSSAQTRTSLAQGSYTVTVTDHNGCHVSTTIPVSQPNQIIITDSVTNLPCIGGSTGAVNITVTGGTGSYHYQWSDSAHTQNISSLTAGTYRIKVTDSLGCFNNDSAFVTQAGNLRIADTVTAVTCHGLSNGSIRVGVTGGTPAYSYRWSGSADTTGIINSLAQGSYTLTVSDRAGCVAITPISVSQPAAIAIVISNITGLPCTGGSTGAVDITVSGGAGSYHYQWSDSAHTQNINSLAAGTYRVKVTDSLGCFNADTATVSQASNLSIQDTITAVTCYGLSNGAIRLSVSGGTPAYSFRWSGSNDTLSSINNLAQGNYIVTVSDRAGCIDTVHISVSQPDSLFLTLTPTNATTHGGSDGSISLSVSGGNGGNAYIWSNTLTTPDLSNLTAGPYCVTVTDVHACRDSNCVTVGQPNGINEVEWVNSFKAYTSAGFININFSAKEEMNISAAIYDLTGNLIYKSVPVYSSVLDAHISDAGIASGCYIVRIATEEGAICGKIIIMQ